MSKPGQPPIHVDPARQVLALLDVYRAEVQPEVLARLTARVHELGLQYSPDELQLLAALDTPARVQAFLNTQIYYNNDHATPDTEETSMSPRQVLETARAHCFEGALFAYAVNTLHGHDPRLVLLEASQDSEHNLVIFKDAQTGLYGCNAHSAYAHLDGRPAEYATVRELAQTYYPWYYSDRSNNPADMSLVGYSDPIDLVSRFGTAWMSSAEPLWRMYYTYIDDTVTLHYLDDDSGAVHLYPLVHALKEGWIQVDAQGHPAVNTFGLTSEALQLWHAFWDAYGNDVQRPQGRARDIEDQFRALTCTTPIDLVENASDFQYSLEKGYGVKQLLTIAPISATVRQPPGSVVTVDGSVSTPSGRFASSFSDQGFGLQDADAGLYVKLAQDLNLAPPRQVRVTGTLKTRGGLRVLIPAAASDVLVFGGVGPAVQPQSVATGSVGADTAGRIVQVTGAVSQSWTSDLPYGHAFAVDDGSGPVRIYVNLQTGIDASSLAIGQRVRVTGFSTVFQAHYEIDPCSADDIVAIP